MLCVECTKQWFMSQNIWPLAWAIDAHWQKCFWLTCAFEWKMLIIWLVLSLYCLKTPAEAFVSLLFVVCTIGTYDFISFSFFIICRMYNWYFDLYCLSALLISHWLMIECFIDKPLIARKRQQKRLSARTQKRIMLLLLLLLSALLISHWLMIECFIDKPLVDYWVLCW